jgi:hypothetical protein
MFTMVSNASTVTVPLESQSPTHTAGVAVLWLNVVTLPDARVGVGETMAVLVGVGVRVAPAVEVDVGAAVGV